MTERPCPALLPGTGLPEGSLPLDYFRRALSRGRLSQAYLFLGPERSERRRFAVDVAKALLCGNPDGSRVPCGTCPDCRAVDHGNHAGLFVYRPAEGKSSIEIADSRDIAEKIHLRRKGFLVVIIEDSDRMTVPAANALLKTLEEPTGDAVIILIARSAGALLPTIVSRCHRIQFPDPGEMTPASGPASAPPEAEDEEVGGGAEKGKKSAYPPASLDDLADPEFHLRWDVREWLSALFPSSGTLRQSARSLLEVLIERERRGWRPRPGEADPAAGRLEDLLDLRSDLDRNVNPDLVVEAAIRTSRNPARG